MAGTLAGTDSWFANPASQVSAHFGVGLDGTIHQYVALENTAWANGILEPGNQWEPLFGTGNPNDRTVSIETEDLGSGATPVTDAQYASVLAVGRLALARFPSITHLVGHNVISPASRVNCPGARWTASRFASLARELGLVGVA
jgi:N-acetyl-anhydromuramyl-L-alanine amidase AmpD